MKKIVEYLEQLDFSKVEAKLYILLLESGPLSVKELAKKANINRTATYAPLNALLEKGVLLELIKHSRKQFAAIEPDQLHYLIDRKIDTVRSVETYFPDFITMINTSLNRKPVEKQVQVRYYKGKQSAIMLYQEGFKAKTLRSFAKLLEKEGFFPNNLAVFNDALKCNKELRIREIIYDTPSISKQRRVMQELARSTAGYSYKIMPPDVKLSGNDILLYNNKVVIIEFKEKIECIVLESESYYNNFKELFDFMWKMLPEPEM